MSALSWMPDSVIAAGVIGGLLFIALIVVLCVAVVVACGLGWIGAQWYDDIHRAEAMRGRKGDE